MINQIQRKIQIPIDPDINYIGLLIGPRGITQSQLEQEFGVKILIRGKRNDSIDDLHLLIIGDCNEQIDKAIEKIEQLFYQQNVEVQRQKLEKLNLTELSKLIEVPHVHQRFNHSIQNEQNCYLMKIPNNKVGQVIGKGGQTIYKLQKQSGCLRISIDVDIEDNMRYILIEGSYEQVLLAQSMILEIIQ